MSDTHMIACMPAKCAKISSACRYCPCYWVALAIAHINISLTYQVVKEIGNTELHTIVEFEEKQIVFQLPSTKFGNESDALKFVPTVEPLQVSQCNVIYVCML